MLSFKSNLSSILVEHLRSSQDHNMHQWCPQTSAACYWTAQCCCAIFRTATHFTMNRSACRCSALRPPQFKLLMTQNRRLACLDYIQTIRLAINRHNIRFSKPVTDAALCIEASDAWCFVRIGNFHCNTFVFFQINNLSFIQRNM